MRLDISVFTAGVLDAKPIVGSAAGDVGFGVAVGVAVIVACLVAFAGMPARSVSSSFSPSSAS